MTHDPSVINVEVVNDLDTFCSGVPHVLALALDHVEKLRGKQKEIAGELKTKLANLLATANTAADLLKYLQGASKKMKRLDSSDDDLLKFVIYCGVRGNKCFLRLVKFLWLKMGADILLSSKIVKGVLQVSVEKDKHENVLTYFMKKQQELSKEDLHACILKVLHHNGTHKTSFLLMTCSGGTFILSFFFSLLNILKLQLKEESLIGEPSGFLKDPSGK